MERLNWVDDYLERIKPFVYLRVSDQIMIKRPNKAYKMNPQAIALLDRLMNKGDRVIDIVNEQKNREQVINDLNQFFCDLRCMLTHGLADDYNSPAIERKQFHHEFSQRPILSEIAITYRCNLKCKFCYAGCNCTRSKDEQELSTEQIKHLLDVIWKDAEVPSVSFTGGEPTLREDLPELIAHARKVGLRVNLITNGNVCDEKLVKELKNAGLNSVQVSLEGTTAQVHDSITQVKGSFDKSIQALKLFQQADITAHCNTTINGLNLEDVINFPKFANSLGLERFSMNLMIPTGTGQLEKQLVVTYSQVGEYLDRIHAASQKIGIEFMWYSTTPLCLYNPISRGMGNKGCAACDGLLSISPTGDILPCSSYDHPVGNLLTQSFEDVWFAKEAKWFRDKKFAPEQCSDCQHFSACQGACPLYWQEMGHDELPCMTTVKQIFA